MGLEIEQKQRKKTGTLVIKPLPVKGLLGLKDTPWNGVCQGCGYTWMNLPASDSAVCGICGAEAVVQTFER